MAVRREVVSLSQLLQRRNSVRREGAVSLSQPSLSDNGSRSATPSSSLATRFAGGRSKTAALSNGCGPFKDSRPPRDEFHGLALRPQPRLPPKDRDGGSGPQGFQNLLSAQLSQHSQSEIGGARLLSQSEDAQEDSWNGYATSQSQSQTCTSQPLYHARQPSIDIAYSQPRSATQSGSISKKMHDSGKELTTARERARGEEEMMMSLMAPVKTSLNDVKNMLVEQNTRLRESNTAEQSIQNDVRSLKDTVERLHDHAKETKKGCTDCHERIEEESKAARCAVKEMGARMGAMEKYVDSFITNMSRFVREELFALHVEREQRVATKTPQSLKQGTRAPVKRRLAKQTPQSRRYSPLPCSSSRKRQRQAVADDRTPALGSTGSCRRSIRIEKIRAKRQAELTKNDGEDDLDDEDDEYGLRLALERVEEARAKRRHEF